MHIYIYMYIYILLLCYYYYYFNYDLIILLYIQYHEYLDEYFPSNANCEINKIKSMKFHNSVQSSLDALTTDFKCKTYCFIYTFTVQLMKDKMKAYSLLAVITLICHIGRYASVEIKPEL